MKKFFKISILVIVIAIAAVACKPVSEQIEVTGCEMESLESVRLGAGQLIFGTVLTLDASNASAMDITLKKLNAHVYSKSGKSVAAVKFDGKKNKIKPVLHRHSEEQVQIPLEVSFDNPLSALSLASMALEDYGSKGYTVSYDCTLKAGCFSKRFHEGNVPVEKLVKMIDK